MAPARRSDDGGAGSNDPHGAVSGYSGSTASEDPGGTAVDPVRRTAVAVPITSGEPARRALADAGHLARDLRVDRSEDILLIPLAAGADTAAALSAAVAALLDKSGVEEPAPGEAARLVEHDFQPSAARTGSYRYACR